MKICEFISHNKSLIALTAAPIGMFALSVFFFYIGQVSTDDSLIGIGLTGSGLCFTGGFVTVWFLLDAISLKYKPHNHKKALLPAISEAVGNTAL